MASMKLNRPSWSMLYRNTHSDPQARHAQRHHVSSCSNYPNAAAWHAAEWALVWTMKHFLAPATNPCKRCWSNFVLCILRPKKRWKENYWFMTPIQTQLSWVVGDLFKPAACQMVWENVVLMATLGHCDQQVLLVRILDQPARNALQKTSSQPDQLAQSGIERGELPHCSSILIFSTASRQRFADGSRLPE